MHVLDCSLIVVVYQVYRVTIIIESTFKVLPLNMTLHIVISFLYKQSNA